MKRQAQISTHAIERYQERFGRGITFEEAKEALLIALTSAKRLHAQGPNKALFEGPPPARMRLVVAEPNDRTPTVVTVLFAKESGDEDMGEVYGPLPDPVPVEPRVSLAAALKQIEELEFRGNRAMSAGLRECNRLRQEIINIKARIREVRSTARAKNLSGHADEDVRTLAWSIEHIFSKIEGT